MNNIAIQRFSFQCNASVNITTRLRNAVELLINNTDELLIKAFSVSVSVSSTTENVKIDRGDLF